MPTTGATLDFDNKGGKTIYDPCPSGYRVPTGSSNSAQGTWGDFSVASGNPYWQGSAAITGSLFANAGNSPWYPASGLRYYRNGTLGYVATSGYSWSASSFNDSSNARYLGFNSASVVPAGSNLRSWGFPVRCVQE